MFKKILCLSLTGLFFSVNACGPAVIPNKVLNLFLNPRGFVFSHSDLRGSSFCGAEGPRTFISVDLRGVNFDNDNLSGSCFLDCIFTDAYFGNSVKFRNVVFCLCNMYNVKYGGTNFFANCAYVDSVSAMTFNGNFADVDFLSACREFPNSGLCRRIQLECEQAVAKSNGSKSK